MEISKFYEIPDWECYRETKQDNVADKVNDIAYQLIHNEPGKNIKVMMGGGRKAFFLKENSTRDGGDYDSYDWNCYSNV